MTRRVITRQDGTRRVVEVSRSGRVKADWPACDSCEGTGTSGPVFTREDGTTEPLVSGCALDGAMGWHNTYRVVREIAEPLGYNVDPTDDKILSAYESGDDVEIRNGDGRHQWQLSRFAGNRTCSACGLLPLDEDDDESECRTYHDSGMVGQLALEIADEATDWLNEHTTRGYWHWDMGELFLQPSCDLDESEPCTLADPDECATHGLAAS